MMRVWEAGLFMLLACYASAEPVQGICGAKSSPVEIILGFPDDLCPLEAPRCPPGFVGVIEGDEVSLQRALAIVHGDSQAYVAVLFYASWCPFSRVFRPTFSILSSLFPSIRHFAIEESSVRPSILSKYGVHGFPTLFIMNSTLRDRYRGPRTLGSLIAFYNGFTGIKSSSLDTLLQGNNNFSMYERHDKGEPEICPFWWARSPENLLHHETYLALAAAFVLLRLLYFLYPTLLACAQWVWRRHITNMDLLSLFEQFPMYLKRAIHLFKSLDDPCKKSNLQEGARNAGVWASKSLATVAIGEASSSRSTCLGAQ
ncbi:hypothetical protein MLD38_001674 [Melastoma candidum]|uniref:Uncharacterized protein n=1 Tax=Melastoma candidum TaxID=119954 RepID=A0ACB9SDA4_9MYRT|nr:hypothetical protein MLD38_001674 [Melastoma candidum]